MPDFAELIGQGSAYAWLFIPSAILLGALHGLEPGHSKTMMAAFIVAIRGTVAQAALLGVAATFSHTLVVWAVALGGMYLWQGLDAETSEPYFQLASGIIIIGVALWMLWRTWQDQQRAKLEAAGHAHGHGASHGHRHAHAHAHDQRHDHRPPHEHSHGHRHNHAHSHHHGQDRVHSHGRAPGHSHEHDHLHGHVHAEGDLRRIDTGHGVYSLEIFEDGVPPRWRLRAESGKPWPAHEVTLETERPDGQRQTFAFIEREGYLESTDEIPEPHEFMARVRLSHRGHSHDYDVAFLEHAEGHDHMHEELRGLSVATDGYQDAHELAHANDIRRRFASTNVTTGQIVLFGLTGGLIPCPAAITVLLLCLQVKEIALGAVLVLCFSIGLAITLVAVGVAASLSVRHISQRWSGFQTLARRAPYFSTALIIAVGLYMGIHGWMGLPA